MLQLSLIFYMILSIIAKEISSLIAVYQIAWRACNRFETEKKGEKV